MKIATSPEARRLIAARGGHAYIFWIGERLHAATEPPPELAETARVAEEGFELEVERSIFEAPGEVHLAVAHVPRPHLVVHDATGGRGAVFWRGLAVGDVRGGSGGNER
jgi:hypothetical protein